MQIRELAFRGAAGVREPVLLSPEGAFSESHAHPNAIAAVPTAILSLLYPAETPVDELALLCGEDAEATWRIVLQAGPRRVRVSRGFGEDTVLLDLFDEATQSWKTAKRGARDVQAQLDAALKLPPRKFTQMVVIAARSDAPPKSGSSRAGSSMSSAILGNEDFALDFDASDEPLSLTPDETRTLTRDFRKARSIVWLDAQIAQLQEKVERIIDESSRLVDSTGELAGITQQLSRIPTMRELTPEERDVLTEGPARVGDFERRISELEEEIAAVQRREGGHPSRPLWMNPLFLGGIVPAVLCTIASCSGGGRELALGNLLFLGIALAGYLRHTTALEAGGRAEQKIGAIRRRHDKLTAEREKFEEIAATLRAQLNVRTLDEYERSSRQRRELESREAALLEEHREVLQSPRYLRLREQQEKLALLLQARQQLRQKLGDSPGESHEMEARLRRAGWDPPSVFWQRPSWDDGASHTCVTEVFQLLGELGFVKEGNVRADIHSAICKLAGRIGAEPVNSVAINAAGRLVVDGLNDVQKDFPPERQRGLAEAMRLSLQIGVAQQSGSAVLRAVVRVHPFREDEVSAPQLRNLYESLSDRMQFVCLSS